MAKSPLSPMRPETEAAALHDALHDALRAAVEALAARYLEAYEREDAAGCAEAFTLTARLDHPFGAPALGRDAIAAIHGEWFADEERGKRMWAIEVEPLGEACLALLGWSAETGPPGEEPPRRTTGVSLAILREDGREWRIHRMALVPGPD